MREAGGTPVRGDVLDEASLRKATVGCAAIVHVAANPSSPVPPEVPDPNRTVRVLGATNLRRVAAANRVPRLVLGSGYWVYASSDYPLTESSALDPRGESQINFEAERAALEDASDSGTSVVVVRPAMVYGDGSWLRAMADEVLARRYAIVEGGANLWSFVSLEDAGEAFRVALDRGSPGSILNVADDQARSWRWFADRLADGLECPRPGRISRKDAEVQYGPEVTYHLTASRLLRAERLRALGWAPRVGSVDDGLPPLLPALRLAPK